MPKELEPGIFADWTTVKSDHHPRRHNLTPICLKPTPSIIYSSPTSFPPIPFNCLFLVFIVLLWKVSPSLLDLERDQATKQVSVLVPISFPILSMV